MMTSILCPNYKGCVLVGNKSFLDETLHSYYLDSYCCKPGVWTACMRFRAKEQLNFCPDFVLPDTEMTINEIIDRFDKENI